MTTFDIRRSRQRNVAVAGARLDFGSSLPQHQRWIARILLIRGFDISLQKDRRDEENT